MPRERSSSELRGKPGDFPSAWMGCVTVCRDLEAWTMAVSTWAERKTGYEAGQDAGGQDGRTGYSILRTATALPVLLDTV